MLNKNTLIRKERNHKKKNVNAHNYSQLIGHQASHHT